MDECLPRQKRFNEYLPASWVARSRALRRRELSVLVPILTKI